MANQLLGIFAASPSYGRVRPADPTLATLLGREPTPLSTALAGLLPAA